MQHFDQKLQADRHLEADGVLRLLWHPFLGLMPPRVYVPSPLQLHTAYRADRVALFRFL